MNFKSLFNFNRKKRTKKGALIDSDKLVNVSSLTKSKEVYFRVDWEVNIPKEKDFLDIDAFAFLLDTNNICPDIFHMVYFNSGNEKYKSKYSMEYIDGGQEINYQASIVKEWQEIKLNLDLIPEMFKKVIFAVSIYNRRPNDLAPTNLVYYLNKISISIFEKDTKTGEKQQLYKGNILKDIELGYTAISGELYRRNGEWLFNTSQRLIMGNIETLMSIYKVKVPIVASDKYSCD